jgi:hypothetical protein
MNQPEPQIIITKNQSPLVLGQWRVSELFEMAETLKRFAANIEITFATNEGSADNQNKEENRG